MPNSITAEGRSSLPVNVIAASIIRQQAFHIHRLLVIESAIATKACVASSSLVCGYLQRSEQALICPVTRPETVHPFNILDVTDGTVATSRPPALKRVMHAHRIWAALLRDSIWRTSNPSMVQEPESRGVSHLPLPLVFVVCPWWAVVSPSDCYLFIHGISARNVFVITIIYNNYKLRDSGKAAE